MKEKTDVKPGSAEVMQQLAVRGSGQDLGGFDLHDDPLIHHKINPVESYPLAFVGDSDRSFSNDGVTP